MTNRPSVPKVPVVEGETSTPEEEAPNDIVTGEIVEVPSPPTSADLQLIDEQEPTITPGEAMPVFSVAEIRKAMEDNYLTPQELIAKLALFIAHPNPTYSLGAMRLLLGHVESVLRLNGITVKAVTSSSKEVPHADEEPPEVPPPPPLEEPDEDPPALRVQGTRLALDRRAVGTSHPWATVRPSNPPADSD